MRKKNTPNFPHNYYEKLAWDEGSVICGIDEVGRGCLAGPVVAAAAIIQPKKTHPLLLDSKVLTEKERLEAYTWLSANAWFCTGIIHHRLIDKVNIWQATLMAMKKALLHTLSLSPYIPTAIVIDAMPLVLTGSAYKDIPIHSFIKGESLSSSIAAASIVAKVSRDALMKKFAILLPGYELHSHKGYGTAAHKQLIAQHGTSIIHRKTFLKDILPAKGSIYESQQTFC